MANSVHLVIAKVVIATGAFSCPAGATITKSIQEAQVVAATGASQLLSQSSYCKTLKKLACYQSKTVLSGTSSLGVLNASSMY